MKINFVYDRENERNAFKYILLCKNGNIYEYK